MARWNNQFQDITKNHKHKAKKKKKDKRKKKKESKQGQEQQQPVSTLLQIHKHCTCDLLHMQKLRNIEYPYPRQNNLCNTFQKELPKNNNRPTILCIGRNPVTKGLPPRPTIPHQTPHHRSLIPHPTPPHLTSHKLPTSPHPPKIQSFCKGGSTSLLLFPVGWCLHFQATMMRPTGVLVTWPVLQPETPLWARSQSFWTSFEC